MLVFPAICSLQRIMSRFKKKLHPLQPHDGTLTMAYLRWFTCDGLLAMVYLRWFTCDGLLTMSTRKFNYHRFMLHDMKVNEFLRIISGDSTRRRK